MEENHSLTKSIYTSLLLAILTILLLVVAWYVIEILLLTFAGVLLAIFLKTLTSFFRKNFFVSENLALGIVLTGLLAILIVLIQLIVPTISEQLNKLGEEIPNAWTKLLEVSKSYFNIDAVYTFSHEIDFNQLLPQGKNILIQAGNVFTTTFGLVGSFVVFIFLGVFFAVDSETYRKGFLSLMPSKKRDKTKEVLDSLTTILRWWLIGMLLSMTTIGILTTLGLWLLGVPLALTLGLIAALLTFIPNMGPILAAIPAVLVGLIISPWLAMYVIIMYVFIQSIESYLITPQIQRRTISQPSTLIVIVQLIMGLLTGILGLALATPLLAVISVLVKRLYLDEEDEYTPKVKHF